MFQWSRVRIPVPYTGWTFFHIFVANIVPNDGHFLSKKNVPIYQCDQKKSPNVYKTCPKMILLEK